MILNFNNTPNLVFLINYNLNIGFLLDVLPELIILFIL